MAHLFLIAPHHISDIPMPALFVIIALMVLLYFAPRAGIDQDAK